METALLTPPVFFFGPRFDLFNALWANGEFAPTACGLNWSILVFATAVEEAVFSVLDGYARAYAGLRQEVWQGYVRGCGRRYGRKYGRGYYRGY